MDDRDTNSWGILPAYVTPFKNGCLALSEFRANVERYVEAGCAGGLVLGSTGEAPLVTEAERRRLVTAARLELPSEQRLVVGVAGASTAEAIDQGLASVDRGADFLLLSTPTYYASQLASDDLRRHFEQIAEKVSAPVLLYDVPKFTGHTLDEDLLRQLSGHPNIAGLKDSTGEPGRIERILGVASDEFIVLCGSSKILEHALASGAAGAILAAAVVAPEPLVAIHRDPECGLFAIGSVERERLEAIVASGIPALKAAMDARGWHGGEPRAPLTPSTDSEREAIRRHVTDWDLSVSSP